MKLKSWLAVLLIHALVCGFSQAKAERQKNLRFKVEIERLMKGEVHFAVSVLRPESLEKKYPELYDMDTLGLSTEKDVMILVGKSVQVVNKPAGFFDDQNLSSEKFVRHILGDQEVTKEKDNKFKVSVPGGVSYKLKTFFDSDDISTLPNSRVIRAVTQAKKLDVISQGSSATMVKEMYDFSGKKVVGGVSVSSFISLKDNRTLMLTYTITALRKPIASKNQLKQNYLDETLATKELMDSFR